MKALGDYLARIYQSQCLTCGIIYRHTGNGTCPVCRWRNDREGQEIETPSTIYQAGYEKQHKGLNKNEESVVAEKRRD